MSNIYLSLIVFILTILSEIIFNMTAQMDSLVPIDKYIGLFIFLALISFVKNKHIRLGLFLFIPTLAYFQMLHINFYGMPVYPSAIYLMFTEVGEIFGTLKEELSLFLIPSLITLPVLVAIIILNKSFKKLKSVPYLQFLFLFYLLYNPARTFLTGNTWGRQPSTQELMGMNIYLSSSYFLGRILPAKLSSKSQTTSHKERLTFTKAPKFEGNIILVLGESLSANHLSLLGQKRKTTPYLDSIKSDPNFFYTKGISSGVSTDVAVAFFMNNTYGLDGQKDVFEGEQCLFKLAIDQGFQTSFYSSQSQQQLRYITNSICPAFINDYKNLEMIDPKLKDSNAADDLKLLNNFDSKLKNTDQFIVLHQRGSHGPYNLRYPKGGETFKMVENYQQDRVNHYHNSILEFDKFMKKLIISVKASQSPAVVIYISDHGEGLGEEGVWGHAALKKPSFTIPALAYFHKTKPQKLGKLPTHLDISLYLSSLLGYKANVKLPIEKYQILGNDMDGFAGYLNLELKEGKIISIKREDI